MQSENLTCCVFTILQTEQRVTERPLQSSVHLSLSLSVCLYIYLCFPAYCLTFIYLFICFSCLSSYLDVHLLPVNLCNADARQYNCPLSLCVRLCVCLWVYLSVCLSVCLSVYVSYIRRCTVIMSLYTRIFVGGPVSLVTDGYIIRVMRLVYWEITNLLTFHGWLLTVVVN